MKEDDTIEYAQTLCFLGEIYRDLEKPAEAIEALDRGIRLHELASDEIATGKVSAPRMVSGVSTFGADQLGLERTSVMIILAEEQIKNR